MMRYLCFIVVIMLSPLGLLAQEEKLPTTLNQYNKKGLKDGMWMTKMPERMGEEAYTEFGTYINGRKYGQWYRLDNLGDVVAIERFKNDVKDGEVKSFEQGRLVCIGNYLGLNPDQLYDTIYVMDPVTHYESPVRISSDRGALRHGNWRYYDPLTGRLIREEEWQVDELLTRQQFSITNSDSLYYDKRNKNLPHMKKGTSKPRPAKSLTR